MLSTFWIVPLVPFNHGQATARLVPGAKMYTLNGAGQLFFIQALWKTLALKLTHISSRT